MANITILFYNIESLSAKSTGTFSLTKANYLSAQGMQKHVFT